MAEVAAPPPNAALEEGEAGGAGAGGVPEEDDTPIFTLPDTYDADTRTQILGFYKKRDKNPLGFTVTADGNLETKEGARIGKRGKPQPAGTILLKRFLPLEPTERETLEQMRLDAITAVEEEYEAEKKVLKEAWAEYMADGTMRAVLLSNAKLAEIDARRSKLLAAARDIVMVENMPTKRIVLSQPYEERKLIGPKDPFDAAIMRLTSYPFKAEHEFGKYVADELAPEVEEAAAAAGAGAGPAAGEQIWRKRLRDGRFARIFYEAGDPVNGFLSPMYGIEFTLEGTLYFTALQAYEVLRAKELGEEQLAKDLLGTRATRTMRLLTARAKNKAHPADARGMWMKIFTAVYQQHPEMKAKLLETGTDAIVYADIRKGPSGIGLAETDRRALDPASWAGENFVGVVLETIRTQMREGNLAEAPAEEGAEGVISEEQQERARVGAIINARRNARGGV